MHCWILIFYKLDSITNRTPCKYGKGCKIQYVLGHAKKYAHWLNDPIKKKNLTEEENNMDTDEDVEMCDETEEETEEESEEETDYDSDDY